MGHCSYSITIVRYSQYNLLGPTDSRIDIRLKQLLRAVSNLVVKFVVSHMQCDVWGMHNNLHVWAEHYNRITLRLAIYT